MRTDASVHGNERLDLVSCETGDCTLKTEQRSDEEKQGNRENQELIVELFKEG